MQLRHMRWFADRFHAHALAHPMNQSAKEARNEHCKTQDNLRGKHVPLDNQAPSQPSPRAPSQGRAHAPSSLSPSPRTARASRQTLRIVA
eukprot:6213487-Pleurochrysis_carterae.AAC.1